MGLVSTVAAGAAALALSVPTAGADPATCAPEDQQCQDQQNPAAGIADQVIDGAQQGMDAARQASDVLDSLPQKRPGETGILVNANGVPWCMPLGQPIPLGVVITSPTGNGQSAYC